MTYHLSNNVFESFHVINVSQNPVEFNRRDFVKNNRKLRRANTQLQTYIKGFVQASGNFSHKSNFCSFVNDVRPKKEIEFVSLGDRFC